MIMVNSPKMRISNIPMIRRMNSNIIKTVKSPTMRLLNSSITRTTIIKR